MPLVVNTNLRNTLTGYLADAKNIKNTLIIVKNKEERDAIPTAVLEGGYFVYVEDEKEYYHYIPGTHIWEYNLPGLQKKITEKDKINAKFIDFTESGIEWVTAEEKTRWNSKQDALPESKGNQILFKDVETGIVWKSLEELLKLPELDMHVSSENPENLIIDWDPGKFKF